VRLVFDGMAPLVTDDPQIGRLQAQAFGVATSRLTTADDVVEVHDAEYGGVGAFTAVWAEGVPVARVDDPGIGPAAFVLQHTGTFTCEGDAFVYRTDTGLGGAVSVTFARR
jgi:hypothetical protein